MRISDSVIWTGMIRIESEHPENKRYPSKSAKRAAKKLRRSKRKRKSI